MRPLVFLAMLSVFGCEPTSRPAEVNACVAVPQTDAQVLRSNIASVERRDRTTCQSRSAPTQRLMGATIHVRLGPGITEGWLTRTLDCSFGPGSTVATTTTPTDLVVSIESDDPETARRILQRSEELLRTSR